MWWPHAIKQHQREAISKIHTTELFFMSKLHRKKKGGVGGAHRLKDTMTQRNAEILFRS